MGIEETVATGVSKLYELGMVVTLLCIIIAGKAWFIKYLLNKSDKLQESLTSLHVDTIKVITELKDAIRDVTKR
jgi:hypothetical protein